MAPNKSSSSSNEPGAGRIACQLCHLPWFRLVFRNVLQENLDHAVEMVRIQNRVHDVDVGPGAALLPSGGGMRARAA